MGPPIPSQRSERQERQTRAPRRQGARAAVVSVSFADGIVALEEFAAAIDRFNRLSPRPNPFLSAKFLRCYALHSEYHVPGAEERLFLIFDGRRLIGCAPMRRTRDAFGAAAGALGLRGTRLRFLAPFDTEQPGLLCAPEDEARVAHALINHLCERESGWGMLELVGQRPGGHLHRAAHALANRSFRVRDFGVEPYHEIELSWADVHSFFRSLPKKMRSNISRQARRLYAAGETELLLASGPEASTAWFEAYCDLDRRSWKKGTKSSLHRDPRRVRFYRELLAGRGGLHPSFVGVVLDGILVAGLIVGATAAPSSDPHGAWCLEMAYDRSLASLGPGHLLLLLEVAQAIERGDRWLNFMQNFAYYKHRWGARSIEVVNVQIIRRASLHNVRAAAGELGRRFLRAGAAAARHAVSDQESGRAAARAATVTAPERERARILTQAALGHGGPGIRRLNRAQAIAVLPFELA